MSLGGGQIECIKYRGGGKGVGVYNVHFIKILGGARAHLVGVNAPPTPHPRTALNTALLSVFVCQELKCTPLSHSSQFPDTLEGPATIVDVGQVPSRGDDELDSSNPEVGELIIDRCPPINCTLLWFTMRGTLTAVSISV